MKLENLMRMAEACGYALILEDMSGSGERFVIGNDESDSTAVRNDPDKEKMEEVFRMFVKWYKESEAERSSHF